MALHLLSTRLQQPSKSLEEFLRQLRELKKHCNFEAVDAKTYEEQMIRDAFIKGLESSNMRQRILDYSEHLISLDHLTKHKSMPINSVM